MAFATWNPADKGSNVTLSNGNLSVTITDANAQSVASTITKDAGKWYWEITIGASPHIIVGVANASVGGVSGRFGVNASQWGYINSGNKITNNANGSYGSSYTTGDVIAIALDIDNGKLFFSKNGTWQKSGDPVAGTGAAFTGLTGTFRAGIGGDDSFNSGTQATANFGASAFAFTPPSGFNAGLFNDVTPVADFSGTPLSGTAPLSVAFTDLSTNTPTSWSWDFGDGNTSTQQNPTNIYAAAGTYTVKLTATNAAGSDTKTATNYVSVAAAATTIQPDTGGGYKFTPFIPRRPRGVPKGKVNKQGEPIIPVLVEEPNKVIHVVWKPVIPEADYSDQITLFQRAMESIDTASKTARVLADLQAEHVEKIKVAKKKRRKKRILQIAQILDELT